MREDIYGLVLLLNSHGSHRVGLMTELDETGGDGNKITAYGAGYSYVGQSITLTLDASQRDYENAGNTDQLLVTPGIGLRVVNTIQLSVNDRILFEDGKKIDEDLWFGVGGGGESWHLAGYSDYVNDLALIFSVFF